MGRDNWKGGTTNSKGYRLIHKKCIKEKDWAILSPMITYAGRYIPEHRMVVALREGRTLGSDDIVRHMDGNKLNNSSGNLLLGTKKDNYNDHDSARKEVMYLKWLLAEYDKKVFGLLRVLRKVVNGSSLLLRETREEIEMLVSNFWRTEEPKEDK